MKTHHAALCVLVAGLAIAGCGSSSSASGDAFRRPSGVYAVVNVEDAIAQEKTSHPSQSAAERTASVDALFGKALGNPAVSGLTLQVQWATLNPAAGVYDWGYVDAAFGAVASWNAGQLSSSAKTIQLIVTPGFGTPSWVLDEVPPCDGLFQSPPVRPATTCGSARFLDSEGMANDAAPKPLPLPWDAVYKSSWRTFLVALAARYGDNPAFVSIAIAGPTATSAEMILPTIGTSPDTCVSQIAMWKTLLGFQYPDDPSYQASDQAFVDAWNAAIDMYGEVFSGLTLVATTGDGLPNFSSSGFEVPAGFAADCGDPPDMDCAAETTILAHFADPSVGGANAKATQTSGLEASRVGLPLGIDGVRRLSESTVGTTRILGGAQLNQAFSVAPAEEGCTIEFASQAAPAAGCAPSKCDPFVDALTVCMPTDLTGPSAQPASVPASCVMSPEQALYNVLGVFFAGTAVGRLYGESQGNAPLNYLQIYATDIAYATAHAKGPLVPIVTASGQATRTSAEDELLLASQRILQMAEK
jgi:hypothetical protein